MHETPITVVFSMHSYNWTLNFIVTHLELLLSFSIDQQAAKYVRSHLDFFQWTENSTLCLCLLSWLSFRNSTASFILSLQHEGSWAPPPPVSGGSCRQMCPEPPGTSGCGSTGLGHRAPWGPAWGSSSGHSQSPASGNTSLVCLLPRALLPYTTGISAPECI